MLASITDERRPQLVRGVGGEVELALAGGLDRLGDTSADGDRAEEDDQRAGSARSAARARMTVARVSLTGSSDLPDDDVVVADRPAGEPEVDAADRRRRRR